jgi:anti-sigma factor RsiW
MMNCQDCQGHLIDHVHDELEGELRTAVALHLASCPNCALESCRLRADVEGITRAFEATPSPAARDRLAARVARAFSPPWYRRLAAFLSRPVPIYRAVAAAAIPIAAWMASDSFVPGADDEAASAPIERPVRVHGYDATTPLADPRLL